MCIARHCMVLRGFELEGEPRFGGRGPPIQYCKQVQRSTCTACFRGCESGGGSKGGSPRIAGVMFVIAWLRGCEFKMG